jgi:hypothetical protein
MKLGHTLACMYHPRIFKVSAIFRAPVVNAASVFPVHGSIYCFVVAQNAQDVPN